MAYTAKIVAARRSESTFVGIIGTQHIDGRIERKIVFGCPINPVIAADEPRRLIAPLMAAVVGDDEG
jgi:hypothetical protein